MTLHSGLKVAVAAIAGALALYCWPVRPGHARLRRLYGLAPGRRWWPRNPPGPVPWLALAVVLAAVLGGVPVGLAVLLAGATGVHRWRARTRTAARRAALSGMEQALAGLVAELRAGTHAATAAEQVADDVTGPPAAVLHTIAGAARNGGDVARALRHRAAKAPELAVVLRPLAAAWTLATRHGLPLADVLASVRRDVAGRVRFAAQLHARLAGPRAGSAVLTALPVVGLAFGELIGADPVPVLLGTPLGHLLLLVGTALTCAGVQWSAHLTTRTAHP